MFRLRAPAADGVDSDGDGICGLGEEDSDEDGVPDPLDSDDDNDGVIDLRDGSSDVDGDGLPNSLDLDSDDDGLSDLTEAGGDDRDGDGRVDDFVDFDHDGLHDWLARRCAFGLQPPDTDGDGIPDFLEPDTDEEGAADEPLHAGGSCAIGPADRGARAAWLLPLLIMAARLRRRFSRCAKPRSV